MKKQLHHTTEYGKGKKFHCNLFARLNNRYKVLFPQLLFATVCSYTFLSISELKGYTLNMSVL